MRDRLPVLALLLIGACEGNGVALASPAVRERAERGSAEGPRGSGGMEEREHDSDVLSVYRPGGSGGGSQATKECRRTDTVTDTPFGVSAGQCRLAVLGQGF